MSDRAGEWATTFDLSGPASLPGWMVAVFAALVLLACIFESIRAGPYRRSGPLVGAAVMFFVVLTGWWALDHLARRDLAVERSALDMRAFELSTRALVPGSGLACLDAIAGETVEAACEKVLFGSPDVTAAAVSYVAAQLSLLASAGSKGGSSPAIATLRRAVEADRFGFVAHVLAARDRCTPDQCGAFLPAARCQQDPRKSGSGLIRVPRQASHGQLASRRQSAGSEHSSRCRAAGSGRGGQNTEQPLFSVGGFDPAGQHHDRGAPRATAA